MSFQQLYYTSCEKGLSRSPGFQFNAVTDGTSGETKRAVEALTSYHPPRSCEQASAPEELERCPVNLCFAPGEPGQAAILASVSYVGRDYSNRTGNYFAHALATAELDADDPALLPIELWRARWWERRQVQETSLPERAGPLAAGPLSREQVARFLDRHPHRGQVPTLLTAAGLAKDSGTRSVLVVAESADEVAAWFAVISYLLPVRLVRRLSFSTYLSRPSRSRLHLLGTVAETNFDLGPAATEMFHLFDFSGERFPQLTPHPLTTLCAAIGVRALPALWGWADTLAGGQEASFDDWHPVIAAAAALGRQQLEAADLGVVASWLATRDDLHKSKQKDVARAVCRQPSMVRGQPSITAAARRSLREVSERTGDDGLWEEVQYQLLEPSLLDRADGPAVLAALSVPAVPAALASSAARVRDRLTATAEGQLRLAADQAGLAEQVDALSLLDWAGQAGARLGPDLLAECGQRLIGPLLSTDTDRQRLPLPQRDQVTHVATRFPEVRQGIAAHLTALAGREPAAAAAALSGLAAEVVTEQDIGDASPIRAYYLAREGLRRRREPARILGQLAKLGAVRDADEVLLTMLWPGGSWRLADASAVLADVDPAVLAGALGWFEATVATRPAAEDRASYARLCANLMKSPLSGRLNDPSRPALCEIGKLHQAYTGAERVRDLGRIIGALGSGESAPAAVLTVEWLAPRVAALPAQKPRELLTVLARLPGPAMRRYLKLTSARIGRPDAETPVLAAALWLAVSEPWAEAYASQLNWALALAARRWRPELLEETATVLDSVRKTDGREFRAWTESIRLGRRAGLVRAWRGIGRLTRKTVRRGAATADGATLASEGEGVSAQPDPEG